MRLYNTHGERKFFVCCIVLALSWLASVTAPFFIFDPITFWEEMAFAVLELSWVCFSTAAAVVLLTIAAKLTE